LDLAQAVFQRSLKPDESFPAEFDISTTEMFDVVSDGDVLSFFSPSWVACKIFVR
jgi:hypothetical protein